MKSWPAGYGKIVLAEVDSTNAEAMRVAGDLSGPTWILAHTQTQGRGRRGRAWQGASGNFTASLVMRPSGTPDQWALRSFIASLALYDTIGALLEGATLSLKWPNDVLVNDRKVAGILLESQADALVMGIGVNLMAAPSEETLEPDATTPISMAECGAEIEPEAFLIPLAAHFASFEAQLQTLGFGPIRRTWLEQAAKLGQTIRARTATEDLTGIFDTIDDQGQLVLLTETGPRCIPAADVYF